MAEIPPTTGLVRAAIGGQDLSTLRALDQKLQPVVEQKRKLEETKMLLRGILSERFRV